MSSDHDRLQELNEQIKMRLAEGNLDEAERLSISLIESAEGVQHPTDTPKEAIGTIISKFVSSVIAKAPIRSAKPTEAQVAEIKEGAVNDEHLRLLGFFHYVNAGFSALFSFVFMIYIGFGAVMVLNHNLFGSSSSQAPPPEMGWLFIFMGLIPLVTLFIYAGANVLVARWLKKRKHRTACLVMAGFNCMSMPIGIILGISTIMVLSREKVKAAFK